MIDMRSLFYELESMGFYEYVLPFMLVFVVVFAIRIVKHSLVD